MRVAIAGAGEVGRAIAHALLATGHRVLLIERSRPSYRPDLVPQAEWLLADACELDTLRNAGIDLCDVVMVATGQDQANLVCGMLAKTEFAVPRVVARINNPANQWLFTRTWGIDVAVSTPGAIAAGVEEAVTVGEIVRLMTLQHSDASIVEVTLPVDSALAGIAIGELRLPADAAIISIRRRGTALAPQPKTRLQPGDEVILVSSASAQDQLRGLIDAASRGRVGAEPRSPAHASPDQPDRS